MSVSRLGMAAAVLLASMVTAGCSTIYADKYNFADGWREGEIESTGSAASIATPQFSDCRLTLPQDQVRNGQFALVKFKYLGRNQRRGVPLAGDAPAFRSGERVYLNVRNCALSLVKR